MKRIDERLAFVKEGTRTKIRERILRPMKPSRAHTSIQADLIKSG